ncbi:hypothetical protein [Dinghuibacter silviterrae]|uniref:Uncharacterized protein n=1 Tax=Dinghuibacter silviterrae TaxID=1539049 RepID=A0A4V3GLN3_9BACT|nr:hypothetical protein [Dinghuibacter silviterrae]TDX00203.1 hypothetical protein EDB95_1221 [Dinghuibacter silviterrae]
MKVVSFLKEKWNLLVSVSAMIVVLLTKVIVPPHIDLEATIGATDNMYLARIVVIAALLLTMYPFALFNQKKHGWFWWVGAVACLMAAVILYGAYIRFSDRTTGYLEEGKQREVVGNHLYPGVLKTLDSIKLAEHLDTVTNDDIVENLGAPKDNYPPSEIEHNSNRLVMLFALDILFVALFIVFCCQALFCSSSKK